MARASVSAVGAAGAREALGAIAPAVLGATQVVVAADDPQLVVVRTGAGVAHFVPVFSVSMGTEASGLAELEDWVRRLTGRWCTSLGGQP